MVETKNLQSINMFELIQRVKAVNGSACPYCGQKAITKYGTYKGKQRYKCNSCGKTFSDFTNTIFSKSHFINKWPIFIEAMLNGASLRKSEKVVGISYVTLFYWRHKLLNAMKKNKEKFFNGTIQVHDIALPYSEKGSKCINYREPRKRGSGYRYYLGDKVSVIFASDSYNNNVSNVVLKNFITTKNVDELLGDLIDKKSILCTNNKLVYVSFCRFKKLEHHRIKFTRNNNSKHSINEVKGFINNFLLWMIRFNGVSSKHLSNYLFWHKFLYRINFDVSIKSVVYAIGYAINVKSNETISLTC